MSNQYPTLPGLLVVLFFGLLTALPVAWVMKKLKQDNHQVVPVEAHVHVWGKWSEPVTSGPYMTQTRICSECGEAEARVITISNGNVTK